MRKENINQTRMTYTTFSGTVLYLWISSFICVVHVFHVHFDVRIMCMYQVPEIKLMYTHTRCCNEMNRQQNTFKIVRAT